MVNNDTACALVSMLWILYWNKQELELYQDLLKQTCDKAFFASSSTCELLLQVVLK